MRGKIQGVCPGEKARKKKEFKSVPRFCSVEVDSKVVI
jgi:hypothetical protein